MASPDIGHFVIVGPDGVGISNIDAIDDGSFDTMTNEQIDDTTTTNEEDNTEQVPHSWVDEIANDINDIEQLDGDSTVNFTTSHDPPYMTADNKYWTLHDDFQRLIDMNNMNSSQITNDDADNGESANTTASTNAGINSDNNTDATIDTTNTTTANTTTDNITVKKQQSDNIITPPITAEDYATFMKNIDDYCVTPSPPSNLFMSYFGRNTIINIDDEIDDIARDIKNKKQTSARSRTIDTWNSIKFGENDEYGFDDESDSWGNTHGITFDVNGFGEDEEGNNSDLTDDSDNEWADDEDSKNLNKKMDDLIEGIEVIKDKEDSIDDMVSEMYEEQQLLTNKIERAVAIAMSTNDKLNTITKSIASIEALLRNVIARIDMIEGKMDM